MYAYSQGIGSAREVARRCEYDPAFQWLTGLAEVNHHTLADYRVEKQKELDELFTQVLAALSKEGLITLEQVMQDLSDRGQWQGGTRCCDADGRDDSRRKARDIVGRQELRHAGIGPRTSWDEHQPRMWHRTIRTAGARWISEPHGMPGMR